MGGRDGCERPRRRLPVTRLADPSGRIAQRATGVRAGPRDRCSPVFVRRGRRGAPRRHRDRRHSPGVARRRRDPAARRRLPRRGGGADRLFTRRCRPPDRRRTARRPPGALLGAPGRVAGHRRAAGRRRRYRHPDTSVGAGDPGAADVAHDDRPGLGRRSTVRPRCPPGRRGAAHRDGGTRRTAGTADGRDHRCIDRSGARNGAAALRRRARRHHRGGLAAGCIARLGCAGVERRCRPARRVVSATVPRTQRRTGRCRHPPDRTVTRRRLRLCTAAEAVLDQHPNRTPGSGDVAARPSGPRRDLGRPLVRRPQCNRGAARPSPAPATGPHTNSSRCVPAADTVSAWRGCGPSRSRRRLRR